MKSSQEGLQSQTQAFRTNPYFQKGRQIVLSLSETTLSYLASVCTLPGEQPSDSFHILSRHLVFPLKLSGFLGESSCPKNMFDIPGSTGLRLCINFVSSPSPKEEPYKLSPATVGIRGNHLWFSVLFSCLQLVCGLAGPPIGSQHIVQTKYSSWNDALAFLLAQKWGPPLGAQHPVGDEYTSSGWSGMHPSGGCSRAPCPSPCYSTGRNGSHPRENTFGERRLGNGMSELAILWIFVLTAMKIYSQPSVPEPKSLLYYSTVCLRDIDLIMLIFLVSVFLEAVYVETRTICFPHLKILC